MTKYNRITDGKRVGYRREDQPRVWVWCNAVDDMSPVVDTEDYTDSCSYCASGKSHTLDAHNASVVRNHHKLAS